MWGAGVAGATVVCMMPSNAGRPAGVQQLWWWDRAGEKLAWKPPGDRLQSAAVCDTGSDVAVAAEPAVTQALPQHQQAPQQGGPGPKPAAQLGRRQASASTPGRGGGHEAAHEPGPGGDPDSSLGSSTGSSLLTHLRKSLSGQRQQHQQRQHADATAGSDTADLEGSSASVMPLNLLHRRGLQSPSRLEGGGLEGSGLPLQCGAMAAAPGHRLAVGGSGQAVRGDGGIQAVVIIVVAVGMAAVAFALLVRTPG